MRTKVACYNDNDLVVSASSDWQPVKFADDGSHASICWWIDGPPGFAVTDI